ncbi:MAG: glycosyl transferase [Bacteroidetes bacterium]|nr:glycosyl transferase [Bacteroidota bacterium]
MKILFAIQGTGNGHLSRARDIYPELVKYGEVDVLISGIQADVKVPFPVKYKYYGMSFIFGKGGGVDMLQTAKTLKLFRLIKDIRNFPVEDYDLIINDFEPVTSWACRLKNKPCIGLSHQSAVLAPGAPIAEKSDWKGKTVLKYYAPVTDFYGFHFKAYTDKIFTPVIRKEVRDMMPTDKGHYTVYLPSYDDSALVEHLSQFDAQWQVFSKHNKKAFSSKNVHIQPIENNAFIESMANSTGVLCGAGFEGPAEALFLGKKVMVIPMQDQYEQQCNAAAAATLGVPVIKSLSKKFYPEIKKWIEEDNKIKVDFPDQTEAIVKQLIMRHAPQYNNSLSQALPVVS